MIPIRTLIAFALLAGCRLAEVPASPAAEGDEKVFLTSTDGPLVVDVSDENLKVRKVAFAPDGNTYLVDGSLYPLNWKVVKDNRRRSDAGGRIAVTSEVLRFDGQAVVLPDGAKMRNVWSAVVWKGWAICLGRTSKTDSNANEEPPFFATELIAFKPGAPGVLVRTLLPSPPANEETAIWILPGRRVRE
jgi:hypothetical protein